MSAIGLKRVVGGVAKAYRAARVEPVGYKKCRDQPKKEKGNLRRALPLSSDVQFSQMLHFEARLRSYALVHWSEGTIRTNPGLVTIAIQMHIVNPGL